MAARSSMSIAGGLALAVGLMTACSAAPPTAETPVRTAPTPAPTPAPSPTPDLPAADSFPMASHHVGDALQVYVGVPDAYEANPGSHYPVVYLRDANWNFAGVRGLVRTLASQGDMEPVILVSICPVQALQDGYGGTAPSRCRDLTPTFVPEFPGSGHAAAFAEFLRSELIPHIDATYRTRPTAAARALVGHSLAGLFTWYAVFHLDGTFHRFIPASASLYWDGHVTLGYEAAYARAHTDLPARIYATVSTGEGSGMVGDRDQLVAMVRSRGYPSLELSTATYVGIEHNSSSVPAFREGLTQLF
jgi:predicted alpha/beta superfamily hydrolase